MQYTYLTFLCNDSYLLGIILLYTSLLNTNSKIPLLVLITNNVSINTIKIIEKYNINYKIIQNIETPEQIINFNLLNNKNNIFHYSHIFSKINIFNQIDYDKIIYLDADIMVLKNIDYLFNYPSISCTIDILCLKQYNKKFFNSGFFIFEPNKIIYNNLINLLNYYNIKNFNYNYFGDQALFNEYFKNNVNFIDNSIYNIQIPFINTEKLKDKKQNIAFIHFIGPKKPWNIDPALEKDFFYLKAFNQLQQHLTKI